MASFNKVILIGNLVGDPELKQTPNGVSVTSFRIAVGRRFAKEGEQQADFIDIVAWRGTAEFICKYFTKGKPILICGALQTRTWTDQNGNKRHATEVVADEASFVESKNAQNNTAQEPIGGQEPMSHEQAAQQFEEMTPDDSLPF